MPQPKPGNGWRETAILSRMGLAVLFTLGASGTAVRLFLSWADWWYLAAGYALCELLFIFAYRAKAARLNKRPKVEGPPECDGHENTRQYMSQSKFFKFSESYLSPWFRGAPLEKIRFGNVLDLVCYGFWYKTWEQVKREGKGRVVNDMVVKLIAETGLKVKSGRNPDIKMMDHLWAPLPHFYRPLFFYLCTEFLAALCSIALVAGGFERHQLNGSVYYTYNMDEPSSENPVLFMHGVGAGHLPYIPFIAKMAALGRPLLMPVFPNVSMRWISKVPTVDTLVEATSAFVKACGVTRLDLVGHSYGSLVASRFLQKNRALVATTTLIDPVCFAMYMPTLLNTFLYTFPKSGNLIMDFAMWMVSRELHTTATFSRNFYWSEMNMWGDRIPDRLLVVLSGGDVLVASKEVKSWLEEETSARVLFHPTMTHAGFMKSLSYQNYILAHWQQFSHNNPRTSRTSMASHTYTSHMPAAAPAGPLEPIASHGSAEAAATAAAAAEELEAAAAAAAAAELAASEAFLGLVRSGSVRPDPFNNRNASFLAASSGISAAAAAEAAAWAPAPATGVQYSLPPQHPAWVEAYWQDQQAKAVARAVEQQRSMASAQALMSLASGLQAAAARDAGATAGAEPADVEMDSDLDLTESDDLSSNGSDQLLRSAYSGGLVAASHSSSSRLLRVPSASGGYRTLRQRQVQRQGGSKAVPSWAQPAAQGAAGSKGRLDVSSSIDLGALSHLVALRGLQAPWGYEVTDNC